MQITLGILEASYWEHFKAAKDLALYLPIDHPKRLAVENALNDIQLQIKSCK
jgi:hypothetical protein